MSTETLYKNLIRPDIADMAPYTPIVPFDVLSQRLGIPAEDIIKLDANENPYGPSPRIYSALTDETYYHIYPDPDSTSLRDALSRYIGVDSKYIVAGQGADELIDLVIRLFVTPRRCRHQLPPNIRHVSLSTQNLTVGK